MSEAQEILLKKKALLEARKRLLEQQQSVIAPDMNPMSRYEAIARMGRQGLTFGFGDELESLYEAGKAYVGTPGTIGQRSEAAGIARESSMVGNQIRRNMARNEYPTTSFLSEMGGGAFQGGVLGNLLSRTSTVRNMAPALRMPILAGGEGALYGAGQADPGGRLEGAALGGTIGAAATPLVAAAGVATMGAVRPIVRRLGDSLLGTPKSRATREILKALDADDITPQEAHLLMRRIGDNAVLADVGDTTQRLGRAVYGEMGKGAVRARRFLDFRQLAGQQELRQSARRAAAGKGFDKGIVDLVNTMETQAKPIYDEVFSEVIDFTPTMASLMKRPAMKSARRQAETLLKNEGFATDIINDVTDVRYMDAVKRALDDQIGVAYRTGNGNKRRILTQLKREFVDEIDRQVPRYAEARQVFSGEQAIREASEYGRTVFRGRTMRLADIQERIEDMTESELQAARLGFLDWLSEEAASIPQNSNRLVNKFAEVPRYAEIVRMLFPDQNAVDDFLQTAVGVARKGQTRNTVMHGSQTALRQADRAQLSPGLLEVLADGAPTPGGLLAQALRLIKGNTKLSPEVMQEMGNILFDPNIVPSRLRVGPAQRLFDIPRMSPTMRTGVAAGISGSQQDEIQSRIPVPSIFDLIGQ